MGVYKRIKWIKREINYIKQEQVANDLYLHCSKFWPFDEEQEYEEEKNKKLEERLKYLENALLAEQFELNCIKGTMAITICGAIFILCKYYIFI
tara:strand:+ start:667 stop:948 length:282 start_codon:yes stop_codon:yes gene_type:complete